MGFQPQYLIQFNFADFLISLYFTLRLEHIAIGKVRGFLGNLLLNS